MIRFSFRVYPCFPWLDFSSFRVARRGHERLGRKPATSVEAAAARQVVLGSGPIASYRFSSCSDAASTSASVTG